MKNGELESGTNGLFKWREKEGVQNLGHGLRKNVGTGNMDLGN